ncbi:carbon-nitrogen hydrolase family protein [Alicyclobacillus kakegawensis]|uniref:carbon-nitrogen hydrolase family protein n=1 Tax=Alicyclobacillus kakegawensis TaxID=392012 RepID=UPI000829F236|nr:carbon-nitrogen hydrolase family protein [Alicyclobacillus kakegawensis]
MRVALIQATPVPGRPADNLAALRRWVHEAGCDGLGADWVVFPELYVTGYVPELWPGRPSPDDVQDWLDQVRRAAGEAGVWVVVGHPSYHADNLDWPTADVGGQPIRSQPSLYNAVSIVNGQGVVATYAKVHLFGEEPATFAAGLTMPVWDTPWGRVGLLVCYDLEFPEAARILGLQRTNFIICPSNNMHPYSDFHRVFATARAMENNLFVIYSNRLGEERGIHFCGGSGVVDPLGRWLVDARSEEGVFIADIEVRQCGELDAALNYRAHRRPHLYGLLTSSH